MSPRLRYLISCFLVGTFGVGLAWAGAALSPRRVVDEATDKSSARNASARQFTALEDDSFAATGELAPGQVLAGAAKANIAPRPDDFGGVWRTEGCPPGPGTADAHPTDFRVRWPEVENCMYAGGNGIGPVNPITSFDEEFGLWARSVAISDGTDHVIMTILDGTYWFGEYANMCGRTDPTTDPNAITDDQRNDCGFFDIQRDMAAELSEGGVPVEPDSLMLATTHAHAAPDFVGAWGGVPQWYMDQVEAAMKASIRAAWALRRPAVIEVGDEIARQFNNERRDAYRSAEEDGLTWFRVIEKGEPTPDSGINYDAEGNFSCDGCPGELTSPTAEDNANRSLLQTEQEGPQCDKGNGNEPKKCPTPSPTPTEEPSPDPTPTPEPETYRAIATVGAYSGHPASGTNSGEAHSDWVGPWNHAAEQKWGGVGLMFETGFGNISQGQGDREMGEGLTSLMPGLGKGDVLTNPDVTASQVFWNQPVTNTVLAGGGASGVFDRPMNNVPAAVRAGKNAVEQCVSASPISVRTSVSVASIGKLVITGGPGELFSNLTNTIKEKNPTGVTMPLSLVNDGLGYIMQSFESDHTGRQGGGFAGSPVGVEYEDAYSIDHCFGDMVLEQTLILMGDEDAQAVSQPPA